MRLCAIDGKKKESYCLRFLALCLSLDNVQRRLSFLVVERISHSYYKVAEFRGKLTVRKCRKCSLNRHGACMYYVV